MGLREMSAMNRIRLAAVLVLVVGVGAAAFFTTRALRSGEPAAVAEPPLDETPISASADVDGPLFDGVVNGIRIFPSSPDKSDFHVPACDAAPAVEVGASTAYGTELDFKFPSDWEVVFELATACGDTLVVFHRELNSPIGGVQVSRVRADPSIGVDAPAGQVSAVTVNGKPAAYIAPKQLAPGYFAGNTMVVIRESFGLTLISIVNPDNAPDALDLAQHIKYEFEATVAKTCLRQTPSRLSGRSQLSHIRLRCSALRFSAPARSLGGLTTISTLASCHGAMSTVVAPWTPRTP